MHHLIILVLQLGGLYWLSNQLQKQLSILLYRMFKTQKRVVWILQLLFWPGVLVHEMSHLIVGRLLLVKTSNLSIIPKIKPSGIIQMGSVMVPRTDRLRMFLIGIAPVFVGMAIIFSLLWLGQEQQLWQNWIWLLAVGYAIFQIANNMFLSSSDVEGALALFIMLAIILGLLHWMGVELTVDWVEPALDRYKNLLIQAQQWLWVPIIIDAVALFILGGIQALVKR